MAGWIAEVEALSAARPPHPALDRHAVLVETELPRSQIISGDGERQMHRSLSVVRRDPAARRGQSRDRGAATEEQQDRRLPGSQRYQARTRIQYPEAKNISIESGDPVEVDDVEGGLQDVRNDRHDDPLYAIRIVPYRTGCAMGRTRT